MTFFLFDITSSWNVLEHDFRISLSFRIDSVLNKFVNEEKDLPNIANVIPASYDFFFYKFNISKLLRK